MNWSKVPNPFSQPATKTLDRNSACVCLWVCIQLRSLCMFELLSIFSFLVRWQLWHGLLASCWGIPPDLLTFRIIASCFNCHGSWGSEVRVNLSCCALGYKCRHTWSLDHSSPAYYSLQTIRFLSLLHSSTCRSWKKKLFFSFAACLLQHFIENRGFLNGSCLSRFCVRPGHKAPPQQCLCCNANTCFSETCGSHLWRLLNWPWMQLTTKH